MIKDETIEPVDTKAVEFLQSIRGQFIMAQALHTAITTLEKETYPETSNIEDMKYIKEHIFNFPVEIVDAQNDIWSHISSEFYTVGEDGKRIVDADKMDRVNKLLSKQEES